MNSRTTIQHNKLMQLENSMLMYGIYNAEMLEMLISTVHHIHNITSLHERLFAGQQSSLNTQIILSKCTRFTTLLHKFITLLRKTNPDYDLVIDRLHLYYDMQLVTFGINKDKNLIILFPVFIQPYTQKPLILYQIGRVPVPVTDQNTQAQSYMHLQVNKPYTALNSETYISIRQQELRTCKRMG